MFWIKSWVLVGLFYKHSANHTVLTAHSPESKVLTAPVRLHSDIAQKLAPPWKNSTDLSAAFCISDHRTRCVFKRASSWLIFSHFLCNYEQGIWMSDRCTNCLKTRIELMLVFLLHVWWTNYRYLADTNKGSIFTGDAKVTIRHQTLQHHFHIL